MFGDLTDEPNQVQRNGWMQLNCFKTKEVNPRGDIELHRRKSHQSTAEVHNQHSVYVRDAHKRYGTKANPLVVLDGLNMTVPKGSIYSLLGASGCGKTTLLSCILGRKDLNSGQIWVLGGAPNSKSSGIPGPRVGYMPQQTGLYGDFTIRETFSYYGWVAGLTNAKIQERFEFLTDLLMLPDTNQLEKTLSGGQQRRLSLAVALLHEPELLILDEPTVGVDPVLRQRIWEHLLQIIGGGKTTVIITTHYIEEARQANLVGLMRGGSLLAEESPEELISRYKTQTLEDVFLKLSVTQNICQHRCSSSDQDEVVTEKTNVEDLPEIPPENEYITKCSDYMPQVTQSHIKALLWKGFMWMWRNITAMIFILLLPATQIPLFCLCIGNDPVDLPVAVVNYETNNALNCQNLLTCDSKQLSCSYLGYLERRALTLIYYDSEYEALQSVLKGKTYASIVVRRNYSDALRTRIDKWEGTSSWDMKASEIDVFRDVSNKYIANYLKLYLYDTFQNFVQDYMENCGSNRRILKLPIKFETPVYGPKYPNFTDFAMPGVLLMVVFYLAVATSAFAMLIERHEGSFERTFVIGITEIELMITHIICEFLVTMVQVVIALICAFVVFNMSLKGSLVLVIALTSLTGFCGMCFGFLVSSMCYTEESAITLILGSFFPMITMCGIFWPVEAMEPVLNLISYAFPLREPTEGLRSILHKGWGFSSPDVYMGFIHIGVWTMIFLTISIIFLKFRKD